MAPRLGSDPVRRRRFWERIVAEYERGHDRQADFTRRRGLNLATFRSWLYRLRRERTADGAAVAVHTAVAEQATATMSAARGRAPG